MTTTEDNEDQGAAISDDARENVIAALMDRWGREDTDVDAYDATQRDLDCILSALAEAAYTVVKTAPVPEGGEQ